jgi:hypothetical protein
MATVVFRCGACKNATASRPIYWQGAPPDEVDEMLGYVSLQVVVSCSKCQQLSVLKFRFTSDASQADARLDYWVACFEEKDDAYLTVTPDEEWPAVQRRLPFARVNGEMREAWKEAERAFAEGSLWTAAGIAYRRVLELGVKALDPNGNTMEPLGQRTARLRKDGHISEELIKLIDTAKAFGNEAAHGAALDDADASIARDLCEAFYRQAFSVPTLLERAKKQLNNKQAKPRKSP